MTSRRSIVGLLAGVLFMAAGAMAQDFRGPGGPGGPGGRGFFGRGGGPSVVAALVAMPEVQTELHLTDEQRAKVDQVAANLRDRMRAVLEDAGPQEMDDLSDAEREERLAGMRTKVEAAGREADEQIGAALDQGQQKRLAQLRLQREGTAAMLRPEMVKQLGLTNEQVGKLREEQGQMPGFAPEDRAAAQARVLEVLTDAQKATLAELKGPEFKFPDSRGGSGMGGPGGPGGMMMQDRKLVKQFDKDGDGALNDEERQAARVAAKSGGRGGPGGGRGFGPPGGPRRSRDSAPSPGPKVSLTDVTPVRGGLYDGAAFRTLFLDFKDADWEAEMADFYRTDVDVPAMLTVDGQVYPHVGVGFRGMSSFMMVGAGSKRSLNLKLDAFDHKQSLGGYTSLNLLNSHEDPTFLHAVLYSYIARQFIPTPKANFARVVINGESWGVYANVQQFDKQFLSENFPSTKGTRWKVPGSPGGDGGLAYLGEDLEQYKRRYEMKGGDNPEAWKALIGLCKVLGQTPLEDLESALTPILDIDGALWFLALDTTLTNGDGYWVRASDYALFLDAKGKFHVIPLDFNETFQVAGGGPGGMGRPRAGGPGGGGAREDQRGGGGVRLDPLVGLDDTRKPLRSRLLAVPALRDRYLADVRTIADQWLDWKRLGPVVEQYRELIGKDIEADTRKLTSTASFEQTTSGKDWPWEGEARSGLRAFADQRREFLLNHEEIKELRGPPGGK